MKTVISVLKVLLMEYVVSALLLLLVALCMYKAGLTQTIAGFMVLFVYVIANFIGGLIMGKAQKGKRLIWGLIMGISYLAILFGVSLLVAGTIEGNNGVIVVALCCVAGSCLGGMMS